MTKLVCILQINEADLYRFTLNKSPNIIKLKKNYNNTVSTTKHYYYYKIAIIISKCKKAKWLSEEALQIAMKRTEVKTKGKKER